MGQVVWCWSLSSRCNADDCLCASFFLLLCVVLQHLKEGLAITLRSNVTPIQQRDRVVADFDRKKAAEEKGAETHVCSEITTKTHDARTELGYGLEILDTHGFVQARPSESLQAKDNVWHHSTLQCT